VTKVTINASVYVEGGVGEDYEDISTVALNILQAEFSTVPAAE
jgi:hypothetical protein